PPTPTPSPKPSPMLIPSPTTSPTPSTMPGTALSILSKATRDAQDISNQLGLPANSVQVASTSTSDPVARILSVIADLQQAYDAFGSERGSFTASPRIDKALLR